MAQQTITIHQTITSQAQTTTTPQTSQKSNQNVNRPNRPTNHSINLSMPTLKTPEPPHNRTITLQQVISIIPPNPPNTTNPNTTMFNPRKRTSICTLPIPNNKDGPINCWNSLSKMSTTPKNSILGILLHRMGSSRPRRNKYKRPPHVV